MESMGKKKPRRPRRSDTPDFRAEIVGLCRRGDRSVGQVAKDFELPETAVPDVVKQAEVELTEHITEVHARSRGTYGARRVHGVLRREGAGCGRRRVARLMRAAGLQGWHRRRRHVTTVPDPRAAFRPDLIVREGCGGVADCWGPWTYAVVDVSSGCQAARGTMLTAR